jgi:hypothetical protein
VLDFKGGFGGNFFPRGPESTAWRGDSKREEDPVSKEDAELLPEVPRGRFPAGHRGGNFFFGRFAGL